ncbi:ROK family protein [Candidatus Woesearchaeota archaeon]|nr:ROK family protein [Candidatus Woesearchaeota archaeon]
MLVECYDVGGTSIRGALVNKGSLVEKVKESTEKDFCSQIRKISKILRKNNQPASLVVIVPGPVDKGVMLNAPPLGISRSINIKKELSDLCDNIHIANDIDAAIEAEIKYGAGISLGSFYLLTISTGIGSALAVNGKRVENFAGEFGHTVLERRDKFSFYCGCSNYGCWVSLSSGMGIMNLAGIYLGKRISAEDVFKLAESKNHIAERIIKRAKDYNAQGIGNMINVMPVEGIVVMGSIGIEQFDKIIPGVYEIKKYTIFKNRIPKIIKTKLGDDIGLLGASVIGEK